jgi:hypothetical protein
MRVTQVVLAAFVCAVAFAPSSSFAESCGANSKAKTTEVKVERKGSENAPERAQLKSSGAAEKAEQTPKRETKFRRHGQTVLARERILQ